MYRVSCKYYISYKGFDQLWISESAAVLKLILWRYKGTTMLFVLCLMFLILSISILHIQSLLLNSALSTFSLEPMLFVPLLLMVKMFLNNFDLNDSWISTSIWGHAKASVLWLSQFVWVQWLQKSMMVFWRACNEREKTCQSEEINTLNQLRESKEISAAPFHCPLLSEMERIANRLWLQCYQVA